MPLGSLPPTVDIVSPTHVRLARTLVFHGARETFVIPAGFCTDLASVPQAFQWLIDDRGTHTLAAIVHDWLCQLAREGKISRRDADNIFRLIMEEEGEPFLKRNLMWAAVRTESRCSGMTDIEREQYLALLPLGACVLLCSVPPIGFNFLVRRLERIGHGSV